MMVLFMKKVYDRPLNSRPDPVFRIFFTFQEKFLGVDFLAAAESAPLDFQRRPGQLPGIVPMQEQDARVAADHFDPFIEAGAPGAALEVVVAVAVAAPAAFQLDSPVETHLLGSDQDGVLHFKFFGQPQIFFHAFIIHPGLRRLQLQGIGFRSFFMTFDLIG